jgi:hypothetical protein
MWNCVPAGMAQTKQVARGGAEHSWVYVQARPGRDAPRLSHQPRVRVRFTSSL